MNRSKTLALSPFVSFVAMFGYIVLLKVVGDSRAEDLRLDKSEMRWFESVWLTVTLFGVLSIWFRSLWRSFRAQQIAWLFVIFVVWPTTALYVWKEE